MFRFVKLLQLVAVTNPVVAKRGAKAPDLGDDGISGHFER